MRIMAILPGLLEEILVPLVMGKTISHTPTVAKVDIPDIPGECESSMQQVCMMACSFAGMAHSSSSNSNSSPTIMATPQHSPTTTTRCT